MAHVGAIRPTYTAARDIAAGRLRVERYSLVSGEPAQPRRGTLSPEAIQQALEAILALPAMQWLKTQMLKATSPAANVSRTSDEKPSDEPLRMSRRAAGTLERYRRELRAESDFDRRQQIEAELYAANAAYRETRREIAERARRYAETTGCTYEAALAKLGFDAPAAPACNAMG